MRGSIEVDKEASEEDVMKMAMDNDNVNKFASGKKLLKIIYRPARILNIVVKEG